MPGLRLEYDWLYGSLGIALFVVGFAKQRKAKARLAAGASKSDAKADEESAQA